MFSYKLYLEWKGKYDYLHIRIIKFLNEDGKGIYLKAEMDLNIDCRVLYVFEPKK